jgi:hypothetical protein
MNNSSSALAALAFKLYSRSTSLVVPGILFITSRPVLFIARSSTLIKMKLLATITFFSALVAAAPVVDRVEARAVTTTAKTSSAVVTVKPAAQWQPRQRPQL